MKEKVWLITGASKGFGLEITKAALANGDKVIATVRKQANILKEELGNQDKVLVVELDVTKETEVIAGVKKGAAHFGRIDVVVNNAGYGLLGATEEASGEEVRKQYDTNVFGMLNVIRAVLPYMRKQGSGHIINISSLFAYWASAPGFGIYGSSKSAVEGISEGLAIEVKHWGINVTAVAPGLFSTNFAAPGAYQSTESVLEAYKDSVGKVRDFVGQLHGNQPGNPSKLADVILRLAASVNPPMHLPVGKDAVAAFRTRTITMQKEVDEWEAISSDTDH